MNTDRNGLDRVTAVAKPYLAILCADAQGVRLVVAREGQPSIIRDLLAWNAPNWQSVEQLVDAQPGSVFDDLVAFPALAEQLDKALDAMVDVRMALLSTPSASREA